MSARSFLRGVGVTVFTAVPLWLLTLGAAHADPAPGYYNSVDTTDAQTLRVTIHEVIDDHTKIPYTSSSLDTWDALESADEDPNNSSRILDVYRNASYPKQGGGNTYYNREHSWPKSLGFPNDGAGNYPYTDCHQLFLSDSSYNSSRSNKPFGTCGAGCSEKVTDVNDGDGGGSGVYPGNSNWTDAGLWETWPGRRGDVARAILYMDVRYEGGTHGVTGYAEPDLIVTDDLSLINSSSSNQSVAYMGLRSVLIQWHQQDPVDDRERSRNDAVEAAQGNRNPFIDHPEWADCIFAGICDGSPPPPPPPPDPDPDPDPDPTGGSVFINEFHYDNSGTDTGEFVEIAGPAGTNLAGWTLIAYNGSGGAMYKSVDLSGTISDQDGCMGTASFSFSGLQNGAPDGIALVDPGGQVVEFLSYEGSFTASDGPASGVTSVDVGVTEGSGTSAGHSIQRAGTGADPADFTWSAPGPDTPGAPNSGQTFADVCGGGGGGGGGGGPSSAWINELHYDNGGSDSGEFVEVAGPAGLDLSGFDLVGYNGSGGIVYKVVALSGALTDQQGGAGTRSFAFSGLQNGSPDGVALVDPSGVVIDFIAYEGSVTATEGPADGMTAAAIGVSEDSGTAVGDSLRLTGTGCAASDFTWAPPASDSPGAVNAGQTISCP